MQGDGPPGRQEHTVAGDGPLGAGPTACFSTLHHALANTPRLRAPTAFPSCSQQMFTELVRCLVSSRC